MSKEIHAMALRTHSFFNGIHSTTNFFNGIHVKDSRKEYLFLGSVVNLSRWFYDPTVCSGVVDAIARFVVTY